MVLNRVGIIGLGLIGGSLGLDLQELGYEVFGLVHREKTAQRAKERKLAQVVSIDPKVISDCSIIIIALPLSQLIHPTSDLINALPQHAVVTDVGSVKAPVLDVWRTLHPRFVASHPMAGTIETGVEAGKHGLFRNRPWIATPDKTTDMKALEDIHKLANSLGSDWLIADPENHDKAVALISHLPVFVSAALLQTIREVQDENLIALAKSIASSGFADTTRVGGGNPNLGVSMAENNSSAVIEAISSYRSSIEKLEKIIGENDWDQLQKELIQTQNYRPSFI